MNNNNTTTPTIFFKPATSIAQSTRGKELFKKIISDKMLDSICKNIANKAFAPISDALANKDFKLLEKLLVLPNATDCLDAMIAKLTTIFKQMLADETMAIYQYYQTPLMEHTGATHVDLITLMTECANNPSIMGSFLDTFEYKEKITEFFISNFKNYAYAETDVISSLIIQMNRKSNENSKESKVIKILLNTPWLSSLLNYQNGCGLTPLHHAYLYGNKAVITALQNVGSSEEIRDSAGRTAKNYQARLGFIPELDYANGYFDTRKGISIPIALPLSDSENEIYKVAIADKINTAPKNKIS